MRQLLVHLDNLAVHIIGVICARDYAVSAMNQHLLLSADERFGSQ